MKRGESWMKFLNVHLEGEFHDRNGKVYKVESFHQSTKEIVNFYQEREEGEDLLVCSVYTKYLTKAEGVRKAGERIREYYGNYEVYMNYESIRNRANNGVGKEIKDVVRRKLVDSKLGKFVDVIEKKSEVFYHKLVMVDGNIIGEVIQKWANDGRLVEGLRLDLVKEGKQVKVNKIKGIEYVIREMSEKEKEVGIVNIRPLEYIEMQKNISWMKERNYRIIDTKEDLLEYVKKMEKVEDVIGFDTETTGLNINRLPFGHPKRDMLVGICLSIEDNEGVYIPIRQVKFNNLDEDFVIETLRPYLCSKSKKAKRVVTHFGAFDWKVMYGYGWDLNITDDTYILQYLIDVREANAVKKLKVMSKKILGREMIDLEDFFPTARGGKKAEIKFSLLPYESVRHYGPVDADITRELYFVLRPKLSEEMNFIYGVEINLLKRLGKVEYYGIRVDLEKTIEMRDKVLKEKEALEREIYEIAGEKFNINSSDQLERILFDKLKYPSHGVTSSGKRSTGKEVLKILADIKDKDGKKVYPLAGKLLEYKEKEKLLNSFLDKILRENVDGYLFPKYNQAGTQSGRIAGNNPNLQQTSGKIRELFIPDSEEYYFLIVDYSQVEYRIMAGLADQYDLVDFFRKNPEADFHIMMYSQMYGVPYDKVTSAQRKTGKTLNFGISYGMSPQSLALKLYGSNTKEQVEDARKKIADYFDSVANIRDYLQVVRDGARLRGYVKTLFNRRRYISEFLKENPTKAEIERGNRKAGNTVVQGTAADIMKFAHVRVENSFEKLNLDARVVASIHDELVILVNKKYNPWYMIDLVRRAMEIDLSKYNFPPLYIGANVGKTWGDGKKDNLEAPVILMERRRKEIEQGMHREPMEDPVEQVAEELKLFALEVIRDEVKKNKVKTVEEAKGIPRLYKYAENYIGKEEMDLAIKLILRGEEIENVLSKLKRVEILGEGYHEVVEDVFDELDEKVETEEEEEKTYINYEQLQNYFEENKDKLKLKSPEIRTAKKVYNERYSVMGFDRKVFIRIDTPTEGMIKELVEYLKENNVPKGYKVYFQIGNKFKETPFHLLRIDRIAIIDIIEKHLVNTEYDKSEVEVS